MKSLPPIDQIGFRWKDHWDTLWWLWVFYCDPQFLRRGEQELRRIRQVKSVFVLYLHILPYLCLIGALGRWVLFDALGLEALGGANSSNLSGHLGNLAGGLALGLAAGLAVSFAGSLPVALAVALAVALTGGLAGGRVGGLVGGLTGGLALGLVRGLTSGLAGGLVLGLIGGLIGGLAGGLAGGLPDVFGSSLGVIIGFYSGYFRPYYLPFHALFVISPDLLRWHSFHPVFWDCAVEFPLPGLDRFLVRLAETEPEEGRERIENLITNYPSQRPAALRAKTILLARKAGRVERLEALDGVLVALPEGKKSYLAETALLREKALAISRQQRYVDANQRPFLRAHAVLHLVSEIQNFQAQVGGFHEPLSSEFHRAAEAWLRLARQEIPEVEAQRVRERTPQVFHAGSPVQRDADAFIPRHNLIGELEA